MLTSTPYTTPHDAVIAHPTMPAELVFLLVAVPEK